MAIYKVLFQPLTDYFFGEDGSFRDGLESAEYFISSRELPTQTTLFGILRYLNLEYKKDRGKYTDSEIIKNEKAVGKSGFCMKDAIKNENRSNTINFGCIRGISSVFINEDNIKENINRIYVSLPKDASPKDDKSYSSVIKETDKTIATTQGKKLIPSEYDVKKGIKRGFISIDNGIRNNCIIEEGSLKIIDSIFKHRVRGAIKINKNINDENNKEPMSSLFKKEYVNLKQCPKEGQYYSFGIYADIEEDEEKVSSKLNTIVGMGLGSSPFKVIVKKVSEAEQKNRLVEGLILNVEKIFEKHCKKDNILYCISPCFIEEPEDVLVESSFSSIETTVNRQLVTNETDKEWKKEQVLYTMFDSGSIFVCEKMENIKSKFDLKELKQIGYNHFYSGGK